MLVKRTDAVVVVVVNVVEISRREWRHPKE